MNTRECSRVPRLIQLLQVFGFACAFLRVGTEAQADDPQWLDPIRLAYERLDAKFKNFSVKGSVFNKDERVGDPPGERKLVRSFSFSRVGDCFKTVRPESVGADVNIYAAANSRYYFSILGNERAKSKSLLDLGERTKFTLGNGMKSPSLMSIFDDSKSSLQTFGFPLEPAYEVLRNNAGHLRAENLEQGGRKFLLLEGDFTRFSATSDVPPMAAELLTRASSRILLDPALDYRIVKWESKRVHKGKEYVTTETFEYDQTVDGVPVLSKVNLREGTPSVGYGTTEIELSDWRFNVNKSSEFYLSHFGIKEPAFAKSFFSGWLRLFLIGIALIVIGFWLYRRTTKKAT